MTNLDVQQGAARELERKFYKYMSAETAAIVLRDSTLRWSTPRTFNDPLDVQFDLRVDVNRASVKALALRKIWDAYYGEEPPQVGNAFGALIQTLRGLLPNWDRDRFGRKFGPSVEQSIDAFLTSLPGFHADVRAEMAQSKILCLTTDPTNDLMWTHYADQHRGIVLRFRTIPDLDSPCDQSIMSAICPCLWTTNLCPTCWLDALI